VNKLATAAFAFLAATGIALAGVDANTASREELESISGIGPATSARIVEERRKRPFADTQDLMRRVKGIGEARLSRMVAAGLSVGGNGVVVTVGGRGERSADRASGKPRQPTRRTARATQQ
jgi:competence protein ComEA